MLLRLLLSFFRLVDAMRHMPPFLHAYAMMPLQSAIFAQKDAMRAI